MDVILISFCIVIMMIHLCYYFFVFKNFAFKKQNSKAQHKPPPVSVIICAKNEAENLKAFLPSVINQKYDAFELILINDRSYDETADVLESYAKQHDFIKIVTIKDNEHFYGNKKYALTLGIKAAKHDCLLFTDADCSPKGKYWIHEMTNQYKNGIKIVLGYGGYQTVAKSFLNKLIRFETLTTALQYFSYAKTGIPYMGVGRNLMYSKTAFLKNKGFYQHLNMMSGDDDLLINQIATQENTAICTQHKAHTISIPKTSWKSWITQKRRHISTAHHYKPLHQFLLGLFSANRLLFWLVFPTSLMYIKNQEYLIITVVLIMLKFTSEYLVLGATAKKLREKELTFYIPLLEFCLLFFQIYIFTYNTLYKPKQWS